MITSVDDRLRYLRFVVFAAILAEGCFFPVQEVMLSSESESESESLLLLEHSELLPESLLLDDDEVEDKLQEELEEDEVLVHEELLETDDPTLEDTHYQQQANMMHQVVTDAIQEAL